VSDVVQIHIGELAVSSDPVVISTILGSCVSVCLFHPEGRGGGMIHFALPSAEYVSSESVDGENARLRLGDFAVETLIQRVCGLTGSDPKGLRAKLAGGAAVIDEMAHSAKIGELNLDVARIHLKQAGIPILGESVGGASGRKIYFYPVTGRLRVSPMGGAQAKSKIGTRAS
jgi:chemotaxis receptor (MCP) glutamine deamidase CheD